MTAQDRAELRWSRLEAVADDVALDGRRRLQAELELLEAMTPPAGMTFGRFRARAEARRAARARRARRARIAKEVALGLIIAAVLLAALYAATGSHGPLGSFAGV